MKRILLFLITTAHFLATGNAELPQNKNTAPSKPRVSIITSLFDGDEFIQGFMDNIVQQSIFNECELILINAHSPGNEDLIIKKYMTTYSNIIYIKLNEDPGIYSVWNLGIKRALADLVTNANLDDLRYPRSLEIEAQALEQDLSIDLVYGDYVTTPHANATLEKNQDTCLALIPEFELKNMCYCLPGPQPMWRKSLHEKYGFFSNDFSSSGDHEMWCRAVSKGAQFKKIPHFISGIYYQNPKGLSTNVKEDNTTLKRKEANWRIVQQYGYLWRKTTE